MTPEERSSAEEGKVWIRCSLYVTTHLEDFADRWGSLVAKSPALVIACCVIVTAGIASGLVRFREEKSPERNWIPADSRFMRDSEWIAREFPDQTRSQLVIVAADNVLEPDVIEQIVELHHKITAITLIQESLNGSEVTVSWDDLCATIPEVPLSFLFGEDFDPTGVINAGLFSLQDYCGFLDDLPTRCYARGLQELVAYDSPRNISLQEIVDLLDSSTSSPVYGIGTNFSEFLGSIWRDPESGKILGAHATLLHYVTTERSGHELNSLSNSSNPVNLEWEEKLVEVVQNFSFHGQVRGFVQAAKSFEEVAEHSIWKDVPLLAASFVAMYIFVILAIGNQHPITHRVILALCGMTSIMMAVCVAISLCSAIGLPYSPVHNILPILLQGLGVDDLFVILQCWDSLPDGLGPSLPVRLGKTMRHAGVAVTITSLTDFAAFSVGSTTVLPCLRSFCLYAALGVLCTYLFQLSFFLACFSLVQRRLGTHSEADGFGRCIPTKTSSEPDLSDTFQRRFCTALFWKPIKAVVILISLALLGLNLYGLWNLRQEFDVTWFVPADSYISKFLSAHRRYFPDRGLIGHAFFGPWSSTSVTEDYSALVNTSDRLEQSGLLLNLESWPVKLQAWNEEYFPREEDLLNRILPPRNFTQRLSRFLSSPSGAKYQRDFHFSSPLSCDEDLPPFTAFRLTFNMRLPSSSREKVQTMDALREILDSSGYSGHTLAWSPYFAGWETDRFIETELWSNMGLAMLCVLLVTIVLIAHPGAAFSVLAMVCLTLVEVAGTMYLWGLTIEIVTSLNLILAVGLCVDYSAHMAHSFMIQRHSLRQERAEAAVNAIGPAVLKGGLSTMLSFMFLALSVSYVFDVFFKVFLLTCLYGLFNGLVLLPVLLSLCGPEPFDLPRAGSERPRENAVIRDTAENFSSVLLQARQPNGIQASEVETHFISGVPGSANGDAVSSV